ncbi:DUF2834 domain-containing protein [Mycobacterium avium]|uniref:DUF2834 domain-containing protein n=2 Tax=Mycobacterium avium TaxID=1764 RepID=UPI0003D1ED32|nr:DUF2834 domain-containing protein [Mycobacterium avium]ETB38600.1 hypothetical protein O974_27160 [Mycobacterium avium 11-0986]MBZ4511172.1 DUF2834 domain-containing protein [Mycobacterium avium subsp. hominissuis]MBZ4536055.1 DUF2834 domain-containing protein [Mycobacterium avium subsp. hominissuis]MBZ4593120.1 DUF2834 domain-containing protein [Mycobacterium avium subsp. hominissuis]MBZ4596816.1 DUF2834 domain-containing protein [Mycobacterium avium subsp. hominissuis]
MTTANQADGTPPVPRSRKILCTVYAAIALAALTATWSNGGPYVHSAADFLGTFWRDAKATSASRFVAADALMLAISVVILMVIEATKHSVRFVWVYVVGSFFVAISVMFPLFLIARELRMGTSETPRLRMTDTTLLAVVGVMTAALTVWIDMG